VELSIHIILISLLILFSILSIEFKRLIKAILAFTCLSATMSAIFYIMGAFYIAVFQLLIYAGAVTVLFLATIHTGEEEER